MEDSDGSNGGDGSDGSDGEQEESDWSEEENEDSDGSEGEQGDIGSIILDEAKEDEVDVMLSPMLARTSVVDATEVRPGALRGPRRYKQARWPGDVAPLSSHFNPSQLVLPKFLPFKEKCSCVGDCDRSSCENAVSGVFCNEQCCDLKGKCANGIRTSKKLKLAKIRGTDHLAVVAVGPIEAGVAIGEYLGRISRRIRQTALQMMESNEPNSGYKLMMAAPAVRIPKHCIIIDAAKHGSLMRFLNHSCNPVADFVQVANGRHHTVVAVTRRAVQEGEEVTVDYGNYLWFRCQCGEKNCRDIHLSSTPQ